MGDIMGHLTRGSLYVVSLTVSAASLTQTSTSARPPLRVFFAAPCASVSDPRVALGLARFADTAGGAAPSGAAPEAAPEPSRLALIPASPTNCGRLREAAAAI